MGVLPTAGVGILSSKLNHGYPQFPYIIIVENRLIKIWIHLIQLDLQSRITPALSLHFLPHFASSHSSGSISIGRLSLSALSAPSRRGQVHLARRPGHGEAPLPHTSLLGSPRAASRGRGDGCTLPLRAGSHWRSGADGRFPGYHPYPGQERTERGESGQLFLTVSLNGL